jgi:phosphatidylglycerophosphate synthase
MSNTGRRVALFLLVSIALVVVVPAAAAPAEVVAQSDVPAIEVPEPAPAEDTPSWTYRFLIPTLLVLAVLVVVLTVVQYFVKVVGRRYRVVQ